MSVEARVQGGTLVGSGEARGKGFNMKKNQKCMPPGTNRGATYTWH